MKTDFLEIERLVELVVVDPGNGEQQRDLAGFLRDQDESVASMPGLAAALDVLLSGSEVRHSYIVRAVEAVLALRYGGAQSTSVATLAADPLFLGLLHNAFVRNRAIESLCLHVRSEVLHAEEPPPSLLAALAVQSYNNEYLYSCSDAEIERASERFGEARVRSDRRVVAALQGAMYAPLPDDLSEMLVSHPSENLPEELARPIVTIVHEPLEERALATGLASFGRITDEVSGLVRFQYEQNPFPRWLSVPRPGRSIDELLAAGGAETMTERFPGERIEILVPGCGTGQHPITKARADPGAAVLGIDLSRASLGYARRKAAESGVENMELLHGDLLDLTQLGRTFHHIDCVGVLHHLGDPAAGWTALAEVLKPRGTMRIGVYGSAARMAVKFARAEIERLGLRATDHDMRLFRQMLRIEPKYAAIGPSLLAACWTMSHLRDTLFHASEHQYSLDEIQATLDVNGLRLLFVDPPRPANRDDGQRATGGRPIADFERWREVEKDYVGTMQMFNFWVEKPAQEGA